MTFNERRILRLLDLNRPGSFHNRSYSAVYMNSKCVPFREKLWDDISYMMTSKKDLDFRLDALGKCHGSIPRNGVNQLKKCKCSQFLLFSKESRLSSKVQRFMCQLILSTVLEKIGNEIYKGSACSIYGGQL